LGYVISSSIIKHFMDITFIGGQIIGRWPRGNYEG